ncbi:chemotaxis protein CheW [Salinibius halmophilus]|uniref:chemotaxis protein CheW n=1 Tax=Salinibius halmophilus TaxID=1853216 RepID=UPI000E672D92|nr:chemotaxis protein CheW [Salinibius halmophilus]
MSEVDEVQVAADSDQFVTFFVGNETFALPMASVAEIVRLHSLVEVPLTPPALLGLSNLRGALLPILSLRSLLSLAPMQATDSTRVLVVDMNPMVGLVVDKVSRVTQAQLDEASHDDINSIADASQLAGVINQDGHLIQVLSASSLLAGQFSENMLMVGQAKRQSGASLGTQEAEIEEDELVVTFMLNNEEYGIDLASVESIVRVPERINVIPQAAPYIIGVMELRGAITPVASLRALFAQSEGELGEHHRILVCKVRNRSGHLVTLGLVVDSVREVINLPSAMRESAPELLDAGNGELASLVKLDQGKRLISLLSLPHLLDQGEVQQVLQEQEPIDADEDASEDQDDSSQLMVIFKLKQQEYGITIANVQEITRLPKDLKAVPKTPDFVEGMANLRGIVLPVIDLHVVLGMPRSQASDAQRVLVLNIGEQRVGFIVDSVVEVMHIDEEHITAAPNLTADSSLLLDRVANLVDDSRMIQIVNPEYLLSEHDQGVLGDL